MDDAFGIASRLQDTLTPLLRGGLPVRVRAWDGSQAGTEQGPTVHLRSPDALRRLLWSPGELGAISLLDLLLNPCHAKRLKAVNDLHRDKNK